MSVGTATTALDSFHPCTQDWFQQAFSSPTKVQSEAWPAICQGQSTLLLAPTGSGKTLAAFLVAIDRLFFTCSHPPALHSKHPPAPAGGSQSIRVQRMDKGRAELGRAEPAANAADAPPAPPSGIRVLYISPLKALGVDVDRNLRAPLAGLRAFAERNSIPHTVPKVAIRSGDTPQRERAQILKNPPDILITTPESLYLMLTSKADAVLATVDTIIVDEIHAVAATKRGAHLFSTLERLERLRRKTSPGSTIQRIGLSATQRPLEEIAGLLGGAEAPAAPEEPVSPRPVRIIDASEKRRFQLTIETPAEDLHREDPAAADADIPIGSASSAPTIPSVWPSIHPRLVELIRQNRSTIIFVNSRQLAERLATAINELAEEEIALAHHGSVAKDTRAVIEDRLKRGELPAMVATSSMELGIDMGAVDLVIQIESPPSIASGIQRIGRAGHQVGAVSTGVIFPKYRGDLLSCSAAAGAMLEGWVEETQYPRNPLDILAQQIVAITSREALPVEELFATIRSAAPFFDLPHSSFVSVLDLLSGRYPSDEFSELRPRINWDRVTGIVSPRKGSQRLAVLNGGTIPDRGLYGVYLIGNDGESSGRVGELDEEMVFESRPGDVFLLGASSWRVMDITRDRVLVVPAPGEPGRMPFWRGDGPGRPFEFGRAIGKLSRELSSAKKSASLQRLQEDHGLDQNAAESLLDYIREQTDASGELPTDKTIVVETFLDEVGDWRVVILTPFGSRIHAPWALLVAARIRHETDAEVDLMWTDDGIVFRLPESHDIPSHETLFPDPEDVEEELVREIGGTALFAAKFRENAARSLLLPRRYPRQRTPLWLQRRKSADLLKVVSRFRSFPILMETYRECLRDFFDMAGFLSVLKDVSTKAIRIHAVRTDHPSPFAGAVLFNYVGNFIYDGDAPLAERRAQTLSLDHAQLRELLGTVDFRELFDPQVVSDLSAELQRLHGWNLSHPDDVHDLLLHLGALTQAEIEQRCSADSDAESHIADWLKELADSRRIFHFRFTPVEGDGCLRYAAAEDAGRLRDALGIMPPSGLADAFLEPVQEAMADLVSQYARTHGPFTAVEVAERLGLGIAPVLSTLAILAEQDRVIDGEFRPGRQGQEWCDVNVLKMLKRRSLAALRKEVEPVEPEVLARFLPDWHGITRPRKGLDGILDAVEQLQGAPLPASTLEKEILPARVEGFRTADLDELCVQGEIIWRGFRSTGNNDGHIGLYLTDHYRTLAPPTEPVTGDSAEPVRHLLRTSGALFFDQIVAAVHDFPNDLLNLLWQLVWNGELTNDTLTPLRSLSASTAAKNRSDRRSSHRYRSRRQGRIPGSEGRWSLLPVTGEEDSEAAPTATERRTATAAQLIERHGILTREMLAREEVAGGFAGLYPILKAMEEAGKVRRGYFVAGLGAAQFASPGADDRLRAARADSETSEDSEPVILAATDPANPWGNALPWPETSTTARPQRTAGAQVIVINGQLIGYLSRTSEVLTTFLPDDEKPRAAAVTALAQALAKMAAPGRSLLLKKIDGKYPEPSDLTAALQNEGFASTTKGLLHKGIRYDA